MGRRANPLALRLKQVMNWPSNVYHPFLQQYVQHIFQHSITNIPSIRASTNQIWINVTLLDTNMTVKKHPKYLNPTLSFNNMNLTKSLSRIEQRTRSLTTSHPYYKPIFKNVPFKDLVQGSLEMQTPLETLQIYRNQPIKLKINLISTPLLNAEVMAKHVAGCLQKGLPLQRVFKQYLKSMR